MTSSVRETLSPMCDMTHSHGTFTCVTRLIHTRHAASICVTCAPSKFLYCAYNLSPMCDMAYSSDTFACVTRLIHTRHAASICVTCAPLEFLYAEYTLSTMGDMTQLWVTCIFSEICKDLSIQDDGIIGRSRRFLRYHQR